MKIADVAIVKSAALALLLAVAVVSAAIARTPGPTVIGPLRMLALGDSYTVGASVKGREGWPAQLAAALEQEGMHVATPELVATSGWTTTDLLQGLDEVRPHGPFALVTLLIGANDQFQGRDVEEYRSQLRLLLARATRLAGCDASRVVVISIPDWGTTPFAASRDRGRIAAEVDRFNQACREEASAAGARWVDVTAVSRLPRRSDLVASDGLHPSAAQYAEWVKWILPAAMQALREAEAPQCRS